MKTQIGIQPNPEQTIQFQRTLPIHTRWLLYALSLLLLTSCKQTGYLQTVQPVPRSGAEKSKLYEVEINGQSVFTASEACFGDRVFETAQCDISGKVSVVVRKKAAIQNYRIRPVSKGLQGKVTGSELHFDVEDPQMLYVETDLDTPLLLFLTPMEKNIPGKNDPNVIFYGPGIHEAGIIRPRSGQTIYLAPGALVKGRIYAENVHNVNVLGRGILDAQGYTSKPDKICGIEFKGCNDVKVEGIGLRTGEWWQSLYFLCNRVEVSWMNLMSFGLNNDGIDIDGVTDFHAHNCFIGCGDDGFGWHAVDAQANGEPPTRDCLAENCVIYNTHAGNGLRVGASMETQLFENITFRNIDVLEHANFGIRSDHSDWANCRNITFENFRLEKPGNAINIKIEKTIYSNNTGFRDERGHISGLNFINLQTQGGQIILNGFDEQHAIRNVTFKDCLANGKPIQKDDIEVNAFVYRLQVED